MASRTGGTGRPVAPALTRSLFTEPVTSSSFRCRLNFGGMVSACGRGDFVPGRRSLPVRCRHRPGHPAAPRLNRAAQAAPRQARQEAAEPSRHPGSPARCPQGREGKAERRNKDARAAGQGGCKGSRCPTPALSPGPTGPVQLAGATGAASKHSQCPDRHPTSTTTQDPTTATALTGLYSGPGRREMASTAAASQLFHRPLRPPRRAPSNRFPTRGQGQGRSLDGVGAEPPWGRGLGPGAGGRCRGEGRLQPGTAGAGSGPRGWPDPVVCLSASSRGIRPPRSPASPLAHGPDRETVGGGRRLPEFGQRPRGVRAGGVPAAAGRKPPPPPQASGRFWLVRPLSALTLSPPPSCPINAGGSTETLTVLIARGHAGGLACALGRPGTGLPGRESLSNACG